MENGDIPDENIQASHIGRHLTRLAKDGRLNGPESWAAGYNDPTPQPWIQVDIGTSYFFQNIKCLVFLVSQFFFHIISHLP